MSRYEDALNLVAEYACDIAASTYYPMWFNGKGPRNGRQSFYPIVDAKTDTIAVGINPDNHYLVYLEHGFATFPMWWAEGRTIPMRDRDGKTFFRKAKGVNLFTSGKNVYWRRDADGNLIGTLEQKRRWVHPGVPPRPFIKQAMVQAVKEGEGIIQEALIEDARERRSNGGR